MSFFSFSEVKVIMANIVLARRQWEGYVEAI